MSIKFISVKCPECGANLPCEEGRDRLFCSYCGTQVIISNDNEHIYRHIDEAEIKKAETTREVRMRELDLEEKRVAQGDGTKKVLTGIWLVLSIVVIIICITKIAIQDDFTTGFLMLFYLGGPVIGGGAYLIFKLIPDKENDKIILNNGGVRVPSDVIPYNEKNYEEVEEKFRMAGFRNINCINMHDVKLGLFQKPGKIESITINGKNLVASGKVFMPDVPITITYHGK